MHETLTNFRSCADGINTGMRDEKFNNEEYISIYSYLYVHIICYQRRCLPSNFLYILYIPGVSWYSSWSAVLNGNVMERAIVLREYVAIFIAKNSVLTSIGYSQTETQRRQNIKT